MIKSLGPPINISVKTNISLPCFVWCFMSVCLERQGWNNTSSSDGCKQQCRSWRSALVTFWHQWPQVTIQGADNQHRLCWDGKHCLFGFQSWVYSVLSVMVLSSKWGQRSVEDYILSVKITFIWLRSCFWPVCIFLPWSCDPVWSPDQKATCLPEPKGRSWQLQGLWSHQKYQVCGRIKYFPYRLKLGR